MCKRISLKVKKKIFDENIIFILKYAGVKKTLKINKRIQNGLIFYYCKMEKVCDATPCWGQAIFCWQFFSDSNEFINKCLGSYEQAVESGVVKVKLILKSNYVFFKNNCWKMAHNFVYVAEVKNIEVHGKKCH